MFLEKLSEFAKQIDMPPPMYQSTSVRYVIHLDANGKYINLEEFADGKNKAIISFNAPFCKRSSGVKPKLLVDNGEYTLGIGREKSDPRRVQEQHLAYVTQVRECAVATHEPSVIAVAQFLRAPDTTSITKEKPDFDPTGNITFRVEGVYPFKLDSVKNYWAKVGWPHFRGVRELGNSTVILLFIRSRAQIAQSGMATLPIVEDLDVLKNRQLRLLTSLIGVPIRPLAFE